MIFMIFVLFRYQNSEAVSIKMWSSVDFLFCKVCNERREFVIKNNVMLKYAELCR